MFSYLQIYDPRERAIVGLADAGLTVLRAAARLVPGRRAPGAPRRILLLRLERIGDLLMSAPAIEAVRTYAPDAEIDLVVGSWNAALARLIPGIDRVEALDAPWLARGAAGSAPRALLARAWRWRARHYDLAINFEGDIRSHALMALSGAPVRIGYDMAGGGPLLTRRVPHDPREHTTTNAWRLVHAAFGLAGPSDAAAGTRRAREAETRAREARDASGSRDTPGVPGSDVDIARSHDTHDSGDATGAAPRAFSTPVAPRTATVGAASSVSTGNQADSGTALTRAADEPGAHADAAPAATPASTPASPAAAARVAERRGAADTDAPAIAGSGARPFRLALPAAEQERAGEMLRGRGRVIGLHASGGRAIKQWPAQRFGEVAARLLAADAEATLLLTGAPGDRPMVDSVLATLRDTLGDAAVQARTIDLTGEVELPLLAALLARCALFITGDTGPMHLAAAVGAPIVAVFGPSMPARYAPVSTLHRVVRIDLPCAPCNQIRLPPARCQGHTPDCLEGISVDLVHRAALDLLAIRGAARAAAAS